MIASLTGENGRYTFRMADQTDTPTTHLNVPVPTTLYRKVKSRAGLDGLQLRELVPDLLTLGLEAWEAKKAAEQGAKGGVVYAIGGNPRVNRAMAIADGE